MLPFGQASVDFEAFIGARVATQPWQHGHECCLVTEARPIRADPVTYQSRHNLPIVAQSLCPCTQHLVNWSGGRAFQAHTSPVAAFEAAYGRPSSMNTSVTSRTLAETDRRTLAMGWASCTLGGYEICLFRPQLQCTSRLAQYHECPVLSTLLSAALVRRVGLPTWSHVL